MTRISGNTNITIFPAVNVSESFQVDCWTAGSNGSITTAGNSFINGSAYELDISSSTQVPAPLIDVVLPPGSNTSDERGAAFGGAACISFQFSANSTFAQIALADYNAFTDPAFKATLPVLNSSICTSITCSRTQTIPLNTSGRYYFVMTNPGQSWAEFAITYALHGLGDSACQNLSQTIPTPYPAVYPANLTASLVYPALLEYTFLPSSGISVPLGSFRNASCFGARLTSIVSPMLSNFTQTANASLLLMDTTGFEIASTLSGSATSSAATVGRCDAGVSSNLCNIVAGGLDPLEHYYLILLYLGEPYTTRSNATRSAIRVDAAFSMYDAGLASSLPACNQASRTTAPSVQMGPMMAPHTAPAPAPVIISSRP